MRFPLKEFYEKHGSSNDFPRNRDDRIFLINGLCFEITFYVLRLSPAQKAICASRRDNH